MLTHRAIRRDYDAAGSVNALLALWAFVDDSTFVTKAGDVGLVYRLYGQDYEGLDHAQRRHVVHQFEAALRLLDERSRVYQVPSSNGRLRRLRRPPARRPSLTRPFGRAPLISMARQASCLRWTYSSC